MNYTLNKNYKYNSLFDKNEKQFLYLLVKYNFNKKKRKKIYWNTKMKNLNNNSRDTGH